MNYTNIHSPLQHQRAEPIRAGGLCYALFTPVENVIAWPVVDPLTGICNSSFQLKAGATWYELSLINSDRSFVEQQQQGPAGHFFKMQVSGYLTGNGANRTLSAGTMPFHQFVVMVKDRDGLLRFLGSADAGADYTSSYTSGDGSNSRKRSVQFNWEAQHPAPIYKSSGYLKKDDIITPPWDIATTSGIFGNQFSPQFM